MLPLTLTVCINKIVWVRFLPGLRTAMWDAFEMCTFKKKIKNFRNNINNNDDNNNDVGQNKRSFFFLRRLQ